MMKTKMMMINLHISHTQFLLAFKRIGLVPFFAILLSTNGYAEIKLSGYFIAKSECPVFQSLRKKTNPSNVQTTINQAYKLLAKNKKNGTYYLIEVNSLPKQRWVKMSCGDQTSSIDGGTITSPQIKDITLPHTKAKNYILAVSWQPSFCETHPSKIECKSQTKGRFDASSFTLHGLWPQPRTNVYCNVDKKSISNDKSKRWSKLSVLALTDQTRSSLNRVMPGSQSNLHRHEWVKHGTCYSKLPEDYYHDSIQLINDLNGSKVRDLFAKNIGQEITSTQISQAFNESFGNGTSNKIKISCKKDGRRQLITEITIGLQAPSDSGTLVLKDAIFAAPNVNHIGCTNGIVDPVGLQ